MISREELAAALKSKVEDEGLSLFDIDYPTVATPTLRVYVWKPQAKNAGGVVTASETKTEEKETVETDAVNTEAVEIEVEKKQVVSERRGVTLDECAKVARVITDWFESEAIEGSENWLLEVSSPGVNRRLRLKEHFESAVGERVKLTLLTTEDTGDTVRKTLVVKIEEVAEESLTFSYREDSATSGKAKKGNRKEKRSPSFGGQKQLTVDLASIEEARIDFVFN